MTNHLTVVESQEDALRAVAAGTVDCALVARATALYWIEKRHLDNLLVGRTSLRSSEYCMAVPNGRQALLAQLSDGLHLVEESSRYRKIRDQWLGTYEDPGVSIQKVLGAVAVVILPLLLILALALLWSWSLRRKVAQRTAELREANIRYRETVRGGKIGLWDWDLATNMVRYSPEWKAQIGYAEDEITDDFEEWRSRVHPDDLPTALGEIDRAVHECRDDYATEFRFRHKDGSWRWIAARASVRTDDSGKAVRVVGSHVDITERKRVEDKARRREAYLERIFDVLPIGLWFADKDGMLLRGNPAGVRIWGAEPHVPISEYGVFKAWRLPSREPVRPEDWALARTIREGVTVVDELLEIEAFDGTQKTILNYTTPVRNEQGEIEGAIVMNLDISDRAALEAQLAQSQKLESVGRLAGGVAHDFNNLLMGIINYADLCRDNLPQDHRVRPWIDEITREAERSTSLTRQLLAFARKQTIAPRVLDLNEAVEGMLKMLRRLIGEDIDLAWQPAVDLWPVKLDPGQIDQILANLCVNARDAIHGVGKVTIETGNVTVDADYCALHSEARPGPFVLLAVSDDGCGMDRETLDHVFEPFFTTKDMGEGTGLGLSTIYGIAKQNEGFVNVYSEPGEGTTFRIYLPRSEAPIEPASEPAASDKPTRGTETVLLVEDEKSIRVTSAHFLEELGYTVLKAETPQTALQLAKAHADTIDLLITDVVMPGMNGRDLADRLIEDFPDLKVIYMSGYTANVIAHRGILDEGTNFLSKPVTRDELARRVREVLDG